MDESESVAMSGTPDRSPESLAVAPSGRFMRALVRHEYGPSSTLRVEDVPIPEIGPDDVLLAVSAAGLDRGTWHVMTGLPLLYRLVGGVRRPKNPVLGIDVSGTVVKVGLNVGRFTVGDEVFGFGIGGMAEYVAVPAAKLGHKPAALGFVESAVLPVSASTALQAIKAADVSPGQRVLVSGASGGVGSYAVQMAVSRGAEVTGLASSAKLDFVRSLGASVALDYERDDPWSGTRTYDVVVDVAGRPSFAQLRRVLTRKGRAVLVGGENVGRLAGGMGRQLSAPVRSVFRDQTFVMVVNREDAERLDQVAEMADRGDLVARISHRFNLEDAPAAMAALERGEVRGKSVVVVRPH